MRIALVQRLSVGKGSCIMGKQDLSRSAARPTLSMQRVTSHMFRVGVGLLSSTNGVVNAAWRGAFPSPPRDQNVTCNSAVTFAYANPSTRRSPLFHVGRKKLSEGRGERANKRLQGEDTSKRVPVE